MRSSKYKRHVLICTAASLFVGSVLPATLAAAPASGVTSSVPAPKKPGPVKKANTAVDSKAASPTTVATKAALDALSPSVRQLSNPKALESAFHAYYAFKAENASAVKKPYLYFVDYGLSNTTARGYVFDMNSLKVVEGPFTVAAGSGSGGAVPTRFSNSSGSRATSLGVYVTGDTYGFSGHSGGRTYSSIGLRLMGRSQGYNDRALARGVVAHGAPYVTASRAGHSQGCPAMEPARAQRLLPKLASGSVVFLFGPDRGWMSNDQWVNAD
jgi:L,D-peptidoglycan transpeptidase YkuD (ErfK/YbiS/YcfS/YnhG family)